MTKVNAMGSMPFQSGERCLSRRIAFSVRRLPNRRNSKGMKVQLLVSESCVPCEQAEKIWRQVAKESALGFSVVNLTDTEGQKLADKLDLKTIPAVIIDGVLMAIGVQSLDEARALISRSPAGNQS